MKTTTTLCALILALGLAPAFAQDDTSAEEPAGEGAAETAPEAEAGAATAEDGNGTAIGGPLDLGEEAGATAGAAPAQPQTYIRETFNDWSLQCLRVAEGDDVCQMYQLLKEPVGGASVAEVSIFKLENGGQAIAGGTFVVPLETLLTQKLSLAVDGGQPRSYDFSFCNQVGCYARVGFTQEDINRFRAGAKAVVSIVPALAPDQRVNIDMSLSGFTAAFGEVSSVTQ